MVSVCSFTHADIRGLEGGRGMLGTPIAPGLVTTLAGRDTTGLESALIVQLPAVCL